ncbi:MAG: efflux RND transporter periplasmic adaptor subunit [Spirochaetes bacterium]|nr:efflux RND transporter periplasmic adaptor subunit [Spirochaetota bacterium]
MKKKLIPIIIVTAVIIASTLYFEVFRKSAGNGKNISGTGTIEVTEIEISSKIAGRIAEIPKAEGMTVNKNELVAKLEYDELSAQLHSVRANLDNSSRNYKRISELYKTGSISRRDYDNAKAAYSMAQAAYDQISASIDNAVLYSPINGIILDSNLETGEMAFPGTPILTIADLGRPWMYIYVNEIQLGKVQIGQDVHVSIDSFPGKVYKAKVVSISNKAEFTPKTIQTKDERVKLVFAVKVAIENGEMELKPGMPADAEIIIPETEK